MDGGFLDLDAETIEAELDEYWREIYKIHKVFVEYPLVNPRVLWIDEHDIDRYSSAMPSLNDDGVVYISAVIMSLCFV